MKWQINKYHIFLSRPATIALILVLAASGLGLFTGSRSSGSLSDGSSVDTTLIITTTSVTQSTETTYAPTPSTTIAPILGDFMTSFLDTSQKEIVVAAWKAVNARPRTPSGWNGSVSKCFEGDTHPEFKIDILRRVQWFRAMAGVNPDIRLNDVANGLAQKAALVMLANGDLSHYPDSSWDCFSEDALQGASRSNLSLGDFGVESIDGYIEDPGAENLPVGHRRWILDPGLTYIGTGDTTNTNALFVIGDPNVNAEIREQDGFIMWPPRGFVPRSQIYPRWSISHQNADFSNASVTITHAGKTIEFDSPYNDMDGYGRQNSLVFEWRRPEKGSGAIHVIVRNIKVNDVFQNVEYVVEPFN